MLDFAIFAVTFVVALLIAVIYLYPGSNRVTTIPGPDPTTKEDGNLADIARAGSLHEYLVDLHAQYGDIATFWMGQELVVSICSPELFKQHSAVFDRPVSLFKLFEPLIGEKSLQYANKADGRNRRKLYDPVLSGSYLHHYYTAIQEVSNSLVKKWSSLPKDEHVPVAQYMIAQALKMALVSLFGSEAWTDQEILEVKHSYDIDLMGERGCSQCFASQVSVLPRVCLLNDGEAESELERRLTDLPEEGSPRIQAFEDARKKLNNLVNKVLSNRKKQRKATDDNLLVDVFIDNIEDKEQMLCDSLLFIIGSFHTTGNLLTWALYFLASHQDVQEKVYKEIKKVLGEDDVEPSTASDLVYLRQVIDETLRCAVVAPWAARYQDFDSELGGHKIPKNTPVIHALGVSLQNEKYFPNPNKFDPDRFSPENTKSRPSLAFQPFGFAGKRVCPGQKFAEAEAVVALVTILRKFKLKMVEGQVVTPTFGIVTHPTEEIWITLQKR